MGSRSRSKASFNINKSFNYFSELFLGRDPTFVNRYVYPQVLFLRYYLALRTPAAILEPLLCLKQGSPLVTHSTLGLSTPLVALLRSPNASRPSLLTLALTARCRALLLLTAAGHSR